MTISLRLAEAQDVPALRGLIEASVLGLHRSAEALRHPQQRWGYGRHSIAARQFADRNVRATRNYSVAMASRYRVSFCSALASNSRNMIPLPNWGWRVMMRPRMTTG